MPTHITARLAWHNEGWDGTICKAPERNTYCVGWKSFPGDVIARERDLAVEQKHAGCHASKTNGYVPPCCYSYNAFGIEEAPAASNPPDFFYGGATRKDWSLPPSTVCVWPYEAMYAEEVKADGYLDNDRRRALTLQFFEPIQQDCGQNLIFYYANYSNPLSEEDAPQYVLIGASRIKNVGDELFYENVSEKVSERYAQGMVWARNVTSTFPDEGIRLPYHRYLNDPEMLRQISITPENPLLCKYGSKHLSDDEAIGLLEQLLAKVRALQEMGDSSEDWNVREAWLLQTIAELWKHRGLYPGLLKVLRAAEATALIDKAKVALTHEGHVETHKLVFDVLDHGAENALTEGLGEPERKKLARTWQLLEDGTRLLYRDVLPRFDLPTDIMREIASDARESSALNCTADQIAENPYLICEGFCGASDAQVVPWGAIDRGVLPSPDLGGKPLVAVDYNDARRFRGLCIEHLRREPNHTFRFSRDLISEIAERMNRLPSWKQAQFSERYFAVDKDFLSEALVLRSIEPGLVVYLKHIHEDERLIERTFKELATRPDLDLRRPITASDWKSWIFKTESPLALAATEAYDHAVAEQVQICERLFRGAVSVVTGPAGTGKTTVIEALVRAVRRSEGEGASILVLAPTGKAADRAREVFEKAALKGVPTVTAHSFLASGGWLNNNLTFKRKGGKRAEVGTLIVDEASMVDLQLAAALFRAINWQGVRRLILVGDPGQLPPIGRGRLFADVIGWLRLERPECLGKLRRNLRQLLNAAQNQGTAIVSLSELFIVDDEDKTAGEVDSSTRLDQELLIGRIHAGGEIDRDLDVIYWDDPARLSDILIETIEARMGIGAEAEGIDVAQPYKIWAHAMNKDPTSHQILTPHRGELHGVEALNEACQHRIAKRLMDRVGAIDGITLCDKVIQIRNRPKSNPIWAYKASTREKLTVEMFNGEIGLVQTFGFDKDVWKTARTGFGPRLKRFAVQFTRKPGITVGYGSDVPHDAGRYKRNEKVEENLELAYAVSIHKAQGSEFENTYIIIPASDARPVSAELVYTALTRASRHCTLLIERDVSSLLNARRRENAQTPRINSSVFSLHVAKTELAARSTWYEAGKIHEALSGDMVRSKSEVIIANLLHHREVPFRYEQLLLAGDGTMRLPDFTISWAGRTFYWEHLGRLDVTEYASAWEEKQQWYERWFPGQLRTTAEGPHLSRDAETLLETSVGSR